LALIIFIDMFFEAIYPDIEKFLSTDFRVIC